ncbi:unnamed protein product, partial [Rotaria socialis]
MHLFDLPICVSSPSDTSAIESSFGSFEINESSLGDIDP